jgi:transcription elongation GreA/GreB family factor
MDSRYISMDAPLGKTLMGRSTGDRVTVATPGGEEIFEIIAVSYQGSPPA